VRPIGLLPAILVVIIGTGRAADVPIGGTVESLPEHQGRSETFAFCSPCHSMRLVAQQGLDRNGWAEVVTWMNEEQGMVALPPRIQELVLDYLAWAFPADRNNAPH
jgi:hypothetical protein